MIYDVIVIGGGPSGIFASIFAGQRDKKVLLLEKMEKLGKKLLIAGQGQCNLTHEGTREDFSKHFGANGSFLKKALYKYPAEHLIKFFEDRKLPLIVTEKGKYFPKTLRSLDVLEVLKNELRNSGVEVKLKTSVKKIEKSEVFKVFTDSEIFEAKKLIIATGGKSYEVTGSSGDGYSFSKELGLKIVEPRPALTPCYIKDYSYTTLAGVSFRNAILELWRDNKKLGTYEGDLLFTHKNLSGPLIIDNSRYIKKDDKLRINFSGENLEIFEKNLRNTINNNGNKFVKNIFDNPNFSERFIKVILKECEISEETKCNSLKKEQIKRLIEALGNHAYEVSKLEGFNIAMVTAGGVALEEINKNTMESKKIKDLYIVGELLDIDGDTGGYNIQGAYSTGALAAESI